MTRLGEIAVFALQSGREYGEAVCRHLGVPLSAHEEREFEDGEHKTRPVESVRGKDVFVVQSLYGDAGQSVNDKLCRLLFFLGALRDASAERITAVVPYLCYSRKDRKSKSRDPVTTRYVAALFEAVGLDRMVTMDVHNLAAFQNAFRIPTEHLEAKSLFTKYFALLVRNEEVVVVSPDVGGVKRAESFREALGSALGRPVSSAFVEKYRSAGVVSGEAVVGDVANKMAIVMDDLISSGTTLARAAQACKARGGDNYIRGGHARCLRDQCQSSARRSPTRKSCGRQYDPAVSAGFRACPRQARGGGYGAADCGSDSQDSLRRISCGTSRVTAPAEGRPWLY